MFMKIALIAVLTIGTTLSQNLDFSNPASVQLGVDAFLKGLDEMCKKANVTDPDVVKGAKDSFTNVSECLKKFINPDTIKNEIEEAKPRGALDEVFKKYCDKSSNLKGCFKTLLDGVSPCVESMQEYSEQTTKAFDQLVDFVCYKDGDRIALFIAEKGPECFTSMSSGIEQCGRNLKDSYKTVESAKKTTLKERCDKFDEVSACIVKSLEGCDTPTPANMAESLIRFIRKGSPCHSA